MTKRPKKKPHPLAPPRTLEDLTVKKTASARGGLRYTGTAFTVKKGTRP